MTEVTLISRRDFLGSGIAAGGGLLVAASLPGISLADVVGKDTRGKAFAMSAYVEIGLDNQVTFTIGKSEMGQGTLTGMAQLLADELGCAWDDIELVQAVASPAYGFPFNGFMITGGSTSIKTEWQRTRSMGAAARMMLQQAAGNRWKLAVGSLKVEDGVVIGPGGKRANFGELAEDASKLTMPKKPALKAATDRIFIGKTMERVDTAQKIAGSAQFGIDVQLPGMLTAIIIAPPQFGAKPISFNAKKALTKPGVRSVVQVASGIAIVGDHYWAVHSARDDVEVEWQKGPLAGIGMKEVRAGYKNALTKSGKLAESKGDIATVTGGRSVTREIEQPFLAHACMEPMNFTVAINQDSAEVYGPTQGQTFTQGTVAKVAGISPKKVTVHTTFLGGGFGRRSAQDFVKAAAEIAKAIGKPVKLVYSREDDMRAARFRSFNVTKATGTIDSAGNLAALDVKIAKPSVSKWSGLKFLIRKDGVDTQAIEGMANLPYTIPNTRVEWVDHDIKLPVHFWRSVGASHNSFVIESLLDDLAKEAGKDPIAFRQALLQGKPRHLAVLKQLVSDSNWNKPSPTGTGRGMAIVESFDSIVAEAAEVKFVDGELIVNKVTCVVDCGVAINPGQIEAQMQGSIVYGLSAFLRGEITLDNGAIEQSNFHDYEPLRMPEMPEISVRILEGSDKPGGIGEPGLPPLLPAVANAIFALNVERITRLPYHS